MFEELHAQPMAVHCHQDNWSSQWHNKAIIPAQRTIPSLSQKRTNNSQKTTCFIIPLRVQKHQKQKKKQTKPRRGFAMFVFYGALWIHPLQPHLQVQKTYAKPLPSAIDSISLSQSFFFFFLAESIDFCLFTSHCEWHPGSALQKAAEAWKEEWHTEWRRIPQHQRQWELSPTKEEPWEELPTLVQEKGAETALETALHPSSFLVVVVLLLPFCLFFLTSSSYAFNMKVSNLKQNIPSPPS
jgi:hypothetical protein